MSEEGFYQRVPALRQFSAVADLANYHYLPDNWWIATTDVVSSTAATQSGGYKLVNTAGASGISAVANAIGHHRTFPFVFGGDGAAFAVPASDRAKVSDALAAVCIWVREDLGLELRAAIVSVKTLREAGSDVLVARYSPAPGINYAMFAGGGVGLAEQLMKQGDNTITPAAPGTRPDLTGLSCRWRPLKASNAFVISLVVVPHPLADDQAGFMTLVREVLAVAEDGAAGQSPVPPEGPRLSWPPRGLAIEVAAKASGFARISAMAGIVAEQLIGWISDRANMAFGRFSARRYRREVAHNSDFRKFDDGLKLTLDISRPGLDLVTQLLENAEAARTCLFGLHKQDSALMTCIVPSAVSSDHIHFIDGAGGGYVRAAMALKDKLATIDSKHQPRNTANEP